MNHTRTLLKIFLSLILSAGFSFAQYPYLTTSPISPVIDSEAISIQIIKGQVTNKCLAPTYSNTSFTISESQSITSPNTFIIAVKYTKTTIPDGTVCPPLFEPFLHGPDFRLGKLIPGWYIVEDGEHIIDTFEVVSSSAKNLFCIKGIVHDDPFPLKRAAFPISTVKVLLKKSLNPSQSFERNQPVYQILDSTITKDNGTFELDSLQSGLYMLEFAHDEFRSKTVEVLLKSDTSLAVTMISKKAYGSLSGTVYDLLFNNTNPENTPIMGCTLIAIPKESYILYASSPLDPSFLEFKALSDTNGNYRIDSIPINYNDENWYITASKDGYTTEHATVKLSNQVSTNSDFYLQKSFNNKNSDTIDSVIFTTATDKAIFSTGEGVNIQYTLKNVSSKSVTYSFSNLCKFDLTIATQAGQVLYRLSDNAVCLEALSNITLQPGQTLTETFSRYIIPAIPLPMNTKTIPLIVTAQLSGDNYQNTAVSVGITVQIKQTSSQNTLKDQSLSNFALNGNTLSMHLKESQPVKVTVYGLDGRISREMSFNSTFTSGTHSIRFENENLISGFYIIKIQAQGFSKAFKMMLQK